MDERARGASQVALSTTSRDAHAVHTSSNRNQRDRTAGFLRPGADINRRDNLALALRSVDCSEPRRRSTSSSSTTGRPMGPSSWSNRSSGLLQRSFAGWARGQFRVGSAARGTSASGTVTRRPKWSVTLDADVVLAPEALDRLWRAARSHPDAVAFGFVHWLPDEAREAVHDALDDGDLAALGALVPAGPTARVEGTIVGADPRPRSLFRPVEEARPVELDPAHGLNTFCAIPVSVLESVGGWDENIVGYGYEDIEFAARLASAGVQAVYVGDAVGFHVWHPKDWRRAALEAERNLDYVLRRLGPEAITDAYADWTVWWHYHRDRGGAVKRDSATLYAVNQDGRARSRLTRLELAGPACFEGGEVAEMEEGELASLESARPGT